VGRGGASAPFIRVRLLPDGGAYVSSGDISASAKALASLLAGKTNGDGVPLISAHVELGEADSDGDAAPATVRLRLLVWSEADEEHIEPKRGGSIVAQVGPTIPTSPAPSADPPPPPTRRQRDTAAAADLESHVIDSLADMRGVSAAHSQQLAELRAAVAALRARAAAFSLSPLRARAAELATRNAELAEQLAAAVAARAAAESTASERAAQVWGRGGGEGGPPCAAPCPHPAPFPGAGCRHPTRARPPTDATLPRPPPPPPSPHSHSRWRIGSDASPA
jgi:hypothetical protein